MSREKRERADVSEPIGPDELQRILEHWVPVPTLPLRDLELDAKGVAEQTLLLQLLNQAELAKGATEPSQDIGLA